MPVNSGDDAADDPAIWLHPSDPLKSLIIGTDKQAGIEVYNLAGQRQQFVAAGRTNNVDLRYLKHSRWSALAAASNRSSNSVSLFAVDFDGELFWLQDSEIATGLTEPYGLCMYDDGQALFVFVNDTDGSYQQWRLNDTGRPDSPDPISFDAELMREFSVPSQPEGCVADDAYQRLFIGVENEGIYALSADFRAAADLQTVMEIDGSILAADVEGMSLYARGAGGYVLVSSQGNYSYAVFDRLPPHAYRGSFVVLDRPDGSVDGVQETDGLAVTSSYLGPDYPTGLVVLQDGYNTLPEDTQNFKFLSWRSIVEALNL